jgi:hypothetical protein
MTMVKCRECGKRVSSEARTCPSCGISPVVAAKDYTVLKNVATVVVISVVMVTCMSSMQEKSADSSPQVSQTDAARGACMLFIKGQLHDPGSAEFQDATMTNRDGALWTVHRAVRAKNALGAYQLQNFECVIRQEGDKLALVALKPY